jgi:DNA-binding XRE family transcriptional regulator
MRERMKKLVMTNIRRNAMLAEMRYHSIDNSRAEINLTVPLAAVNNVVEAIRGMLKLSGHEVFHVTDEGERLYSIEEVFPEASPGMMLRGLRGKEELTQAEFAKRLGVSQHHVSEMENNKRKIGLEMAKRIGEEFKVPYKMFL